MKCGQPIWSGASGVTSTVSHQPTTRSTLFVLASTTKTVTATMAMKLVEEGRLSLDAPLSQFYPQLPDAHDITVRMLLNHTSGLPEYSDDPKIADTIAKDPRHSWTTDEIVAALSRMQPEFPPGTDYTYTNSNYVVLGGIIDKAGGVPLEASFQQMVAKPAGMTQSTFTYQPSRSGEFAHPYLRADDGSLSDQFVRGLGVPSSYWGPVWTDGGLASTAVDLARFGNALFANHLVSQSSVQQMAELGAHDYGFGVYDQHVDGHTWLGHDGAYGGYESENWTDSSRQVTIAVTTNVDDSGHAADTTAGASNDIWQALVKAYDKSNVSPGGC